MQCLWCPFLCISCAIQFFVCSIWSFDVLFIICFRRDCVIPIELLFCCHYASWCFCSSWVQIHVWSLLLFLYTDVCRCCDAHWCCILVYSLSISDSQRLWAEFCKYDRVFDHIAVGTMYVVKHLLTTICFWLFLSVFAFDFEMQP